MGMYWGEFKTAVLGKMFSSKNGSISTTSKNNRDYVTMMPQAVNEGLSIIGNTVRWPRKNTEIEVDLSDRKQSFNIADIAMDFKRVGGFEIYLLDDEDVPNPLDGASIVANRLIIPAGVSGNVVWYYDGAYEKIESDVRDTDEIDADDDVIAVLVLYVVSQLYMDDDLTTALNWRTQFDSALSILAGNNPVEEHTEFQSVNGW